MCPDQRTSLVMTRRSSAVEQSTVNQLPVGSIPTAGARIEPVKMAPPHGLETTRIIGLPLGDAREDNNLRPCLQ